MRPAELPVARALRTPCADEHAFGGELLDANEIAYRWSQEVSAMGNLSNDELEMVYKTGIQPTVYLANK
jgi:hypothetical protein